MSTESVPDGSEFSISNADFQGKAVLKRLATVTGFKILLADNNGRISDQAIFKYPAYRIDTADINRDGNTDILVGLIKATEFDPVEKKRLFILRIDDGHLRPLWLGSKVCQELVDFKASDKGHIQTLERTKSGNYAIGLYEWESFGLTLLHYLHNEIPHNEASEIFLR